jgi:hypothetical protein
MVSSATAAASVSATAMEKAGVRTSVRLVRRSSARKDCIGGFGSVHPLEDREPANAYKDFHGGIFHFIPVLSRVGV